MAKTHVEIFTAGCPLCERVVELVRSLSCPDCEITIYDLHTGCSSNECREKADRYGIQRVPAVAVNGARVKCCQVDALSVDALRAAIPAA